MKNSRTTRPKKGEKEMGKKLFVGNLSYKVTEPLLRELIEKHGKISTLRVPIDRDQNRPRGFAFVEMETEAEASKLVKELHGVLFLGRDLVVDVAKPSASGKR